MMGRSHLITGVCALGQVHAANELISKVDLGLLKTIQKASWSYLGLLQLVAEQGSVYGAMLSAPLYLAVFFLGVLLPDIDSPNSLLGRMLHLPVGHRTWLHAIYIWLIPAVLGCFNYPVFSWLFFGVFVHLFWDSFSVMGNCWFYKLFSDYREYPGGAKVKKGHRLKLYYAGKWSEYILLFVIVAVTVVLIMLANR